MTEEVDPEVSQDESEQGAAEAGQGGVRDAAGESSADPPDGAKQDASAGPPSSSVDVDAGGISSGRDTQIAEHIENVYSQTFGLATRALEVLGQQHGFFLSEERLGELTDDLFVDGAVLDDSLAALDSHRLVVISGEDLVGKGAFAAKLCALLQGKVPTVSGAFWVRSPERDIRIRFDRLDLEDRQVLVFEDALDRHNSDLLRLLGQLDDVALSGLRDEFLKNDLYVVMTSDSIPLERCLGGSTKPPVVVDLPLPSVDQLKKALVARAGRMVAPWEEERRERTMRLIQAEAEAICSRLHTIPRITRFVVEYLPRVSEGQNDLRQLLDRVDNLEEWLLDELAQSPLVFSFVAALTVLHCTSGPASVPWLQLQLLWEKIAATLGDGETSGAEDAIRVRASILRTARAEMVREPFPQADTVRFVEASYADRLWEVLLGAGRMIATTLVPELFKLAREADAYSRSAAARALGRLGQIDPEYIVRPWIRATARSRDLSDHVALAEFFQGVLVADAKDHGYGAYAAGCLAWLQEETAEPTPRDAWVRAVCIREMGAVDLARAATELKRLLREKIGDKAGDLNYLEWMLRVVTGSTQPAVWHDRQLDYQATLVFPAEEREVLRAIRFAIVGLCLVEDPIRVFSVLTEWLSDADRGLAAMVSFLFLDSSGVASTLDLRPHLIALEGESVERISRVVRAASLESGAPTILGRFLERVYGATRAFPQPFRVRLRHNFLVVLRRWFQDGITTKAMEEAMFEVGVHLLRSRNGELRQEVLSLLQQDREFAKGGTALHDFAVRVVVA